MKTKIKVAYIGLGCRGTNMLKSCFAEMSDVEIVTLCDTYVPCMEQAADMLESMGRVRPKMTTCPDEAINDDNIDAVIIMTGWRQHAYIAEKSLLAGKYTACEVGGAFDISECQRLVDAHEKTGAHLMMLENCCYGRREMMALNLTRKGLLGEIVHCAGGYLHYLPQEDILGRINPEHPHYRLDNYIYRNCENYPTHELGPISKLLNINRGNRMLTLSSFASKSRGLNEAAKTIMGEDSPYVSMNYKQGDIITTVITCSNGETIRLTLDTTLPRPYYSRDFTVRGTKGMYAEERRVLYFEGMPEPTENNEKEMFIKYDHPLHAEYEATGTSGGHGGMDWLVCRAFVESVKKGIETPIDVYDTALWMANTPLSEQSIALGGAPVYIPDFTRGKWFDRKPCSCGKYSLDTVNEDKDTPIYPDK